MLAALAAIMGLATMNAQALKSSKFTDNTYIGVSIGVNSHPANWSDDHDPELGTMNTLRLGKWLTPVSGLEVDGSVTFYDFYRHVNYSTVGLNYLLNLNNAIHGYKGEADRCEVVPFVGLAWMRQYDNVTNDLASKMGVQVNFNLGKAKAWQINILPAVTWKLTNDKGLETHQPYFHSHRADLSLQVGVTYRFKNQYGTHNFALCDKLYTQDEFDELNNRINKLRHDNKRLRNELDACNTREPRTVYVEKTVAAAPEYVFPVVGYTYNSAVLPAYALNNVAQIADVMKTTGVEYILTGYASEEGTEEYNADLALRRAESLKAALVEYGVAPEQLTVVGAGETTQFGESLELNRVVVTTKK